MNLFVGLIVFALVFGIGLFYVSEQHAGNSMDFNVPLITGNISLFSISISVFVAIGILFFGALFLITMFEDAMFH